MNAVHLLRPLLTPAAQGELSARFDRASVRDILEDTFLDYESQRANLPREASAGARVMVHLAALTIGLYRALLSRGISEDEARSLTARITSKIYSKMAAAPTALSRLGTRSTRSRVKRATDLFRCFPFSQQSYDMVDVDEGNDVVAFDVRRCPVAEYFRGHDLGDVCVESWCNLDFGLAERWGARLERRQTIAGGATHCDFRWHIAHPPEPDEEDLTVSSMEVGLRPCACTESFHGTRLVAVTGGPGAGKTAVLAMALRSFCSHVSVLPEAAGVVFGGGFPRRDTDVARQAAQRAIFHIQRELEAIVTGEGRVAVGLCDRGTVDGAAYWPGPVESFWSEVGTSLEDELARYSAVIHLRTPAVEQGYNHENALRVESASQARSIDERILAAWAKHPCRLVVDSDDDFLLKAARAMESIRDQLPPCCRVHSLPHESAGRGE